MTADARCDYIESIKNLATIAQVVVEQAETYETMLAEGAAPGARTREWDVLISGLRRLADEQQRAFGYFADEAMRARREGKATNAA